jgi:hypothetical protein
VEESPPWCDVKPTRGQVLGKLQAAEPQMRSPAPSPSCLLETFATGHICSVRHCPGPFCSSSASPNHPPSAFPAHKALSAVSTPRWGHN